MQKIIVGVGVVLLIVAGILWWLQEEPPSSVPKQESPSGTSEKAPPSAPPQGVPTQDPPPPPLPPSPPIDRGVTESKKEVGQGREAQMASLKQFVYELRKFLLHIGRARAIEEGRYSPKEGEEPPSLSSEMGSLAVMRAQLPLDGIRPSIISLLTELFDETEALADSIREPPTEGALRRADIERKNLQKKADDLLSMLEGS